MITVQYGSGYNVWLDDVESKRLGAKYEVVEGQCYKNCIRVLLGEGLDATYVEGFLFDEISGMNHGWLEKDGIIIDPGWKGLWEGWLRYIPLASYTRPQVDVRTERNIKPPYCARDYHRKNFLHGIRTAIDYCPVGSRERISLELVEKGLL